MKKNYQLIVFILLVFSYINFNASAQWQQTGGPKSFEVLCFAAKDSNIYIGTYNTGFYLSTDKGQHWIKKSNSIIDNSSVTAISIKDSIIFLGTGWSGVFKSSNNGSTWEYIANGFLLHSDTITSDTTTHPYITDLIWSNNNLVAATGEGIYYSSDMGQNWNFSDSISVNCMIIKLTKKDSVLYAASLYDGIFKSTDDGVTWSNIGNAYGNHVYFIASNSTSIIVQCDTNKFYRSYDDGASWQILNTGIPADQNYLCNPILCNDQGMYIGTIGHGIYYSSDNGDTWTTINNGLTLSGYETLFAYGTDLYAGGYTGVYYSSDNGLSWECRNGNIGVYSSPRKIITQGGNIVGLDYILGMIYSPDNGETWMQINNGLPISSTGNEGDIASLGTELIFACPHHGIFFSTDTGKTWQNRNSLLPCPGACKIAISGTDIYITNDDCGVFMSSDTGLTWTSVQNGLPSYTYSRTLVANDSIVYAVFENCNIVYETRDKGNNWTEVNLPSYLWNIEISGQTVMFLLNDSVKISTDNGYTWVNTYNIPYDSISGGLDIYSGTTDGNSFYLGTQRHGIYKLFSNYWLPINEGFTINPNFNINSIAIQDTILFAAISGDGVWKRTATDIENTNCSAQFDLDPDTLIQHHYFIINNASGIPPLTYLWNWGDGTYDTIAYPSHQYDTAGYYNICLTITDYIGCTSTYCDSSFLEKIPNTIISVDVIPNNGNGFSEVSNLSEVVIYPNPAVDHVNIIVAKKAAIEIININGQIIKSIYSNSATTTVDLTNLAKGIYVVKIMTDKKVITKKIFIE